jgi:hypothetical protein
MTVELRGVVREWSLGPVKRKYITVETTYGEARELFGHKDYPAKARPGEGRYISSPHVSRLRQAMEAGTFTPTSCSAGLGPGHAAGLRFEDSGRGREAVLDVAEGDHLPLTNGRHRFDTLEGFRRDAEKALAEARTAEEKAQAQALLDRVDAQPITVLVHLDGDTGLDTVNLQLGRRADSIHKLSVAARLAPESPLALALQAARLLHTDDRSPLYRCVRFAASSMAPLPVTALCPERPCDLGTSLVGLAKVGQAAPRPKDAAWMAQVVIAVYQALLEKAPRLLDADGVLAPLPEGTRGSATMMVGLGMALAYRLLVTGGDAPTPHDLDRLVEAARETLDYSAHGDLSADVRRALLAEFVRVFFADLPDLERDDGLPRGLLKILGRAAFRDRRLKKQATWYAPEDAVPCACVPAPGDDAACGLVAPAAPALPDPQEAVSSAAPPEPAGTATPDVEVSVAHPWLPVIPTEVAPKPVSAEGAAAEIAGGLVLGLSASGGTADGAAVRDLRGVRPEGRSSPSPSGTGQATPLPSGRELLSPRELWLILGRGQGVPQDRNKRPAWDPPRPVTAPDPG